MHQLPARISHFHQDTTQSTNEDAKQYLGMQDFCLFTADQQTGGKGRGGRAWHSPVGNLFFSLRMKIQPNWPKLGTLSHLAGLAVQQTILPLLPDSQVKLKWPNDVLVLTKGSAAKICGILLESHHDVLQSSDYIIIGIGINIDHHPDASQVHYPTASLKSLGVDTATFDRHYLCAALADQFVNLFDQWLIQGFPAIRQLCWAYAYKRDAEISIRPFFNKDEYITGIYTGLDDEGGMKLATAKGEQVFHSGDVFDL